MHVNERLDWWHGCCRRLIDDLLLDSSIEQFILVSQLLEDAFVFFSSSLMIVLHFVHLPLQLLDSCSMCRTFVVVVGDLLL
jgi:hypothetical protein